MKRPGIRILALFVIGLLCLAAAPSAQADTSAKYAALVLDADTGTILFERQAAAERHPASLTKIMTLYMLFDAIEDGTV